MQISSQTITSTLPVLQVTTHLLITLNNFYDQRVLTPRNNKRRIIRISWSFELSSPTVNSLQEMNNSSRGSVHSP